MTLESEIAKTIRRIKRKRSSSFGGRITSFEYVKGQKQEILDFEARDNFFAYIYDSHWRIICDVRPGHSASRYSLCLAGERVGDVLRRQDVAKRARFVLIHKSYRDYGINFPNEYKLYDLRQ